jgi:hypothetical protein
MNEIVIPHTTRPRDGRNEFARFKQPNGRKIVEPYLHRLPASTLIWTIRGLPTPPTPTCLKIWSSVSRLHMSSSRSEDLAIFSLASRPSSAAQWRHQRRRREQCCRCPCLSAGEPAQQASVLLSIRDRPQCLPAALARAMPPRTRSAIIARSNSANTLVYLVV